jgi:hypothetical protein
MGHARKASNINISDRIKQVIILTILILIGILISKAVDGHPLHPQGKVILKKSIVIKSVIQKKSDNME